MTETIFDMSGVYGGELFSPPGATVLDFKALNGTNCYCAAESADAVRNTVAAGRTQLPGMKLNWIDTGDYHYLTAILMESVCEPFELLLYDNHSDRQALAFEQPGMLSCGSWVQWALDHNPNLRTVRWVNGDGVLSTTPNSSGSEMAATTIGASLPLYLSIDLDILGVRDFTTDWNQGSTTFDWLKTSLIKEAGRRKIHGIDICGGLTAAKGARSSDLTKNKALRLALREYILENFNTTSL